MESLKIECGSETDKDMFPLERSSDVFPNAYHLAAHSAVGFGGTYVLHLDHCDNSVAAALSDKRIEIKDAESLSSKLTISAAHEKTLCGVRFPKAEEHKLLSGSNDGTIKMWDLRGDCSKPAVVFGQTKAKTVRPLTSFDLSCDGRTLCAGTEQVQRDSFLLFWELGSNADPAELRGGYWESHEDDVTAVRFHPEKVNVLASGGTDGIVNVFDISRESEEEALETCLNSESSIQRLSWFDKDGADALCCLTHTEEALLWKVDDFGPFKTFSREDVCVSMRRNVTERAYNIDAFENRRGGELMVLCGSSDETAPCLRLAQVKKSRLKSFADLGSKSAPKKLSPMTRCASFDATSGCLYTGAEDGVICLWRPGSRDVSGCEATAVISSGDPSGGKMKKSKKDKPKPY